MIPKTKAEKFFTREELEKIKNTTREVETHTLGEIAAMVVESSSRYLETEVIGGIALGSLLSLVATVLFFNSSVWLYIPLNFILFFPCSYILSKLPTVKAAFIGVRRKNNAVKERALRAFYEKGLYRTKQNTGVLFFISMLERKVWVLADKGVNEKITQETLNSFAMTVSQGIKAGRSCDALCEAIKEAGKLLAKHFPVNPEDTDELSDEVLTE